MSGTGARTGGIELAAIAATAVLLVASVAVRGLKGSPAIAPQDRPSAPTDIAEPMQLLGRGASLRIEELTPRISPELAGVWKSAHRLAFNVQDCPKLLDWIDGPDGQKCERLIGSLRRGSRDEALASLALTLALARTTEWKPGLLARTQHAEKLGAILQEWLRSWGERGASDRMLAEPTFAALAFYGRVMRTAAEAPPVGRFDAPYERARAFLAGVLLDSQGQPTALGRAMRTRFPAAMKGFDNEHDCLEGFEREGAQLFADVDGECGQ